MKKKNSLLNAIAFIVSLLPLGYLAVVYGSLPAKVAVHYNSNMQPDEIKNKSELWLIAGILAAVSFLTYLLLQNLHRFDPKRRNQPSATFNKLGFGLVVFMAALSILIIESSHREGFTMNRLIFPLIGLLFVFLGNYLPAIKPNYFAGIRLPWTLSDDDNWRRTHFLAGRLWFWCGLGFALLTLFLPLNFIPVLLASAVVIMVLIPGIYSYRIFRDKNRLQE
jgi:uncharacterized membrane protein